MSIKYQMLKLIIKQKYRISKRGIWNEGKGNQSKRDKDGNYTRYFVGYEYNNTLSIEFDNDNKKLGIVLYALSKCSSAPEFSIKYKMKDYSEMKEILLERSVADAKKKALIISKAADVKLGEIISIDYSWSEINLV